jgi:hypothetical protein
VDETFGGGEGKMKGGARREVESGLTAFARDFEFYYKFGGGAALGGILMLIWGGGTLGRNFDIKIGRAA